MANKERIYSVNLEELVQDFVWGQYKNDLGFFKRMFVRRSQYYVDVPWGYVDFKHETTSVERPSCQGEDKKEKVELYYSEYENRTNDQQSYTFNTSRETVASTKIELQENYTIGAETNLEVDLGGIVKFGGSVSGELSVTNTSGQEYTETLAWSIDTEVIVPKWHKAKASLYVFERPCIYDFTTKTTVSLPTGKLPCSVRRLSDNKLMKTYVIMNIDVIMDEEFLRKSLTEVKEVEKPEINKIVKVLVLTTKGVCRNISYKNQQVQVESKPLADAPEGAFNNEESGKEDGGD